MCGIWGMVSADSGRVADATGVEYIRNRGPDGMGQHSSSCFGWQVKLVHTRLAVIDLGERSNQPMIDSSERSVIAFNGEIYNYRELRQEMESRGARFRTEGDTEVLLESWVRSGLGSLNTFNGMFAFAVLDKGRGELTLVRDRFGVKPLVWGRLPDGGIVFSSSLAGVAKFVGDEPDLAYCARGCFYGAFDRDDGRTPFKHVSCIPAGGFLRIKLGGTSLRIEEGRWYDLSNAVECRVEELASLQTVELTEQCYELVSNAVALRLRSDVPVGCSLSGGLDSASIAAVAAKSGTRLRAFSFGHPAAPRSEGPVVARLSQVLGLQTGYIWHTTSPPDMHLSIERTLQAQEAPFTSLSVVAQQEVFNAVHQAGIKVLLGGQGGDEGFAGYRKFGLVALRESIAHRQPLVATKQLFSFGAMLLSQVRRQGAFLSGHARYFGRTPPTFKLLDLQIEPEQLLGDARQGLRGRQILDVVRYSLPTLLRYEDRNSSSYGVESRLPFLDYRLMETAVAMPVSMKIRRGYAKWVLRAAMAPLVPEEIRLDRSKRGFDVAQDWIGAGLGDYLRESLGPEATASQRGYLRRGAKPEAVLSNEQLTAQPSLLAEALVALWLNRPVRDPVSSLALKQ